jgi:hypothetical protein
MLMATLTSKEFQLFKGLCALTQKGMHDSMLYFLQHKYTTIYTTEDYILAEGDIPIALCAHMDTVFMRPAQEIYYDREQNVLFSPDGLGADDRAGIFAIIKIINSGLRPHIILTTDEERGAKGALEVATLECPFKDLKYIIELDRRGRNDCVFYDCDNPAFVAFIESYNFCKALGSFSDISIICPEWGIAGVNLSIGYENEHSLGEVLHVDYMNATIERVKDILQENGEADPQYKYIPSKRSFSRFTPGRFKCVRCGYQGDRTELIPVKTDGLKTIFYCPDCITTNTVRWCHCCGEAYEASCTEATETLCGDCVYENLYS